MSADTIHTNEKGGKQSFVKERFDLIPGSALRVLAGVYGEGATKYAPNNWRLIDFASHLNHALNHLAALAERSETNSPWLDPLEQYPVVEEEDHLAHAFCRLSMAIAIRETGEYETGDPRIGKAPVEGKSAAHEPPALTGFSPMRDVRVWGFYHADHKDVKPPAVIHIIDDRNGSEWTNGQVADWVSLCEQSGRFLRPSNLAVRLFCDTHGIPYEDYVYDLR